MTVTRTHPLHVFAMAAVFAVALAQTADAAEKKSGEANVALNVIGNICTRCHDTSPTLKTVPQRMPGVAPSFLTVAADPKIDRERLIKFLKFPHGDMDVIFLTRKETEGVADYILSLRQK